MTAGVAFFALAFATVLGYAAGRADRIDLGPIHLRLRKPKVHELDSGVVALEAYRGRFSKDRS